MKLKIVKQLTRVSAILLAITLFFFSVIPTDATKTTSELESELSDLKKEQSSLSDELDEILLELQKTNTSLETIRKELAVAKGQEEAQYEAMMTRIKYMYENGSSTILEMLLTSSCLAELISRAEYYSAITEYDRKLLAEYTENCKLISENEAKLSETQEYLVSLQNDLAEKEKSLKGDISDVSAKLRKARDEAKKAEETANAEIKPIVPESNSSSSSSTNITNGNAVSYTEEDVILLAGLIECEAGSSHTEGMLAVGAVVVNRMKSRYYPNTLYGVIYQPNQFPPATNGKLDRILARGVKETCKAAAIDALNGKSNVENCVSFRAASSGYVGTIIGDNVFFF